MGERSAPQICVGWAHQDPVITTLACISNRHYYYYYYFNVKVGVHQGSVLIPLLFIIVLEAFCLENSGTYRIPGTCTYGIPGT